ncbi:hypothetical protein EDEG_01840, partial [Edhazardia aedis USNM 41457]
MKKIKDFFLVLSQTIFSIYMIYLLNLFETMPIHCLLIAIYTPVEFFLQEREISFYPQPGKTFLNHAAALLGTSLSHTLSHSEYKNIKWEFTFLYQIISPILAVLYLIIIDRIASYNEKSNNRYVDLCRFVIVFLAFSWQSIMSFRFYDIIPNEFSTVHL